MIQHIPVLYQEILEYLRPHPGGRYIDGTLGAGGHAAGLLSASSPDGTVLAFDRDPQALRFAREQLREFGDRIRFVHASYAEMQEVAPEMGFDEVDGILLDLGLSSRQLADTERGFSFASEGMLDMRFDPTRGETAADLVNHMSEKELSDLMWRYGEVKQSRKFARAIVQERPIYTSDQLAELIARVARRRGRIHPATQVFQALRIAVNDELTHLERGLQAAITLLGKSGRLAVISFHSLEDRIVKQTFRQQAKGCICPPEQIVCTCDAEPVLKLVTRKALRPTEAEVSENPRSRSARLRVAEKL